MSIIKIKASNKGKRLDVFLAEYFFDKSRSFWQKQIKDGLILVNDKPSKVHEFLKENDKILIKQENKKNIKSKNKKLEYKYKILHEEKDYLIVDKPAGMLTHQTGGEPGLAETLLKDYPEIEGVGEKYRWGIVHRLDRDVSGVLLVARTTKFFRHIKKQFKDRKVKKLYLALVYGDIKKEEDDIRFVIARAKGGKMAARPEEGEGKEASTYFEVLCHFTNYAFLQVRIFTGRTHQIRAHMLAYGHPVVGDKVYMYKSFGRRKKIKLPYELNRIFLHSHVIGFKDMKDNEVGYKSKLPKELNDCLKNIK